MTKLKCFRIGIWTSRIKRLLHALTSLDAWFGLALLAYNKYGRCYAFVKRIPKFSGEEALIFCEEYINSSDVAIVIQGPIWKKDDFTLKTIKLYKRIFTDAKIILSTWDNEEGLEEFKKLGICVITSSMPENMGTSHVNAQLKSTRMGILAAQKMGVKYVLKIRTDWRINYPYSFNYLKVLLQREKEYTGMDKIVVIDCYNNRSFKMPPFVIPDFIYFGKMKDMIKFVEIPDNNCPYKDAKDYMNKHNLSEIPNFWQQCTYGLMPEYYIATSYLKAIGENGDFTNEDYYKKCLLNYFVFVSPWDMDLYWTKYKDLSESVSWLEDRNKNVYMATYNMSYCDYIQYVSGIDIQED